MKRTIFCVALTLCAAIMAGCAVQAPDRVQSPISAQTELPQMRKADDAAEVVTTLLPQMEDERSKTEDSADTPLLVERAETLENADAEAENQPTAAETAPPTTGGDPLTIVNNLSDFIFSVIKAIGIIILGWGIVQVGMSVQSHDASQRTQGLLCLFGGLLIAFAKEILTLIGAV
jgi:hypothetical protein